MNPSSCCPSYRRWWRLPLLLGIVLATIVLLNGHPTREDASESVPPASEKSGGDAARERVSLTIVYGDGRPQTIDRVDWQQGMTVLDVMQAAPDVGFLRQGAGESAFLTTINGLANEGAGGKNWMYSVNGERGDRSFAVYELRPGDRVLWTFAPQQ
jgi:hypothetical protein